MRPPSRPSQTAVWWLASASWWWLARNFSLWSGRPHRPGQGVNTYRLEITRSAGLQALQTNQHTTWTEKLGTTESFYCTVICTQYSLLLCNTGWIKIQCQAIVGLISGWNYYEFGVNETQQSGLDWYISCHPNQAYYSSTLNSDSPCTLIQCGSFHPEILRETLLTPCCVGSGWRI